MHLGRSARRFSIACALTFSLVLLALPAAGWATTLESLSNGALARRATTIVLATVSGTSPHAQADGTIVTDVDLAVSDTIKGTPAPTMRCSRA